MVRRSPTSEDFYAALEEIKVLHDRKQSDYGRAEAPFANVEKSADFGIEPWVGALVRGNDKMGRLQKAASGGTLSNEGVEDSLMDMAVYALIALVEYRAMNESSYDPYQFDQTDDELAAEWLEKNRNFDGPPDGYEQGYDRLIDLTIKNYPRGGVFPLENQGSDINGMLTRLERELAEKVQRQMAADMESSVCRDGICQCNGGES